MKFFIDTANLQQIADAAALGVLDGVTTNPSLMAKEGITEVDAHYKKICALVPGDVSAEVIATDYEGIVREGRHLATLAPNIVVKVPLIAEGIRAIKTFSDEGIRTNCTLCFSPVQALVAAKAGATYISPFIGRLDDIGHDGMDLIRQIRAIYDSFPALKTEILGASLRHTFHVMECALAGCDVVTMPYSVILGLLKHPLTDSGLAQFLADHKKANEKK